jgi:hypothetical protein
MGGRGTDVAREAANSSCSTTTFAVDRGRARAWDAGSGTTSSTAMAYVITPSTFADRRAVADPRLAGLARSCGLPNCTWIHAQSGDRSGVLDRSSSGLCTRSPTSCGGGRGPRARACSAGRLVAFALLQGLGLFASLPVLLPPPRGSWAPRWARRAARTATAFREPRARETPRSSGRTVSRSRSNFRAGADPECRARLGVPVSSRSGAPRAGARPARWQRRLYTTSRPVTGTDLGLAARGGAAAA